MINGISCLHLSTTSLHNLRISTKFILNLQLLGCIDSGASLYMDSWLTYKLYIVNASYVKVYNKDKKQRSTFQKITQILYGRTSG